MRTALSLATAGVACVAGLSLVPPAIAAAQAPAADAGAPVEVRLDGHLRTDGLPGRPAVSELAVRNAGSAPLSWRLTVRVDGTGASAVHVRLAIASAAGCDGATLPLAAGSWSTASLAPGAQERVCVTVSSDGSVVGTAVPTVTVDAVDAAGA